MPEPSIYPHRRTRRSGSLAAAALVTAGVVAGCTANTDLGSPRLPSPTVSKSPSTANPTKSATMSATPEQQAIATVRLFFDALNVASRTGDTAAVRALSTAACCASLIDAIGHDFSGGRHAENGVWSVTNLKVVGRDRGSVMLTARWVVSAYRVVDRAGNVVDSSPGSVSTGRLVVMPSAGRLQVVAMTRTTYIRAKGPQ